MSQHPQHGLTVTGLVLSICGIVLAPCLGGLAFPLSIAGPICAAVALDNARAQTDQFPLQQVRGLAVGGIVVGVGTLFLEAFMLFLFVLLGLAGEL